MQLDRLIAQLAAKSSRLAAIEDAGVEGGARGHVSSLTRCRRFRSEIFARFTGQDSPISGSSDFAELSDTLPRPISGTRMRKWVKRSMLGLALVMALIALFLTGGFVLLRGTPDYYRQSRLTDEQRAEAATRAELKISQMQNMAVDARGAELQRLRGVTQPTTLPGATTFSFTDDELNALFNKWAELYHWKDVFSSVVQDPMIALHDGRIIFAGKVTLKGVDTIVSIHFAPTITSDGKLNLKLAEILGGKLPLPKDTVISPMRQRIVQQISASLPSLQSRAKLGTEGAANDAAVNALLCQTLLHTLNDEPAAPVIFLPQFSRGNKVPFKVTDVSIVENTISFTVIPMTAAERTNLIDEVTQPVQQQ
jgi:hypothetical protein